MASNIPPRGPEVEGDEREESEDEDDEDYEPTVDDSVVVSFRPDEAVYVDLSETIAETAAAELSISEAFEEALEAVRRSEESLPGAVEVVVDSDEETEGEDANDGRYEQDEVVETTEEKGKGGGGESEGLDKTDGVELDRSLFPSCPVCFETWSADGPHRVCCIPCGHVYGRSCLERWFKQFGKNIGKCPQCNRKFRRKEMINLYAPLIVVPNDDLEKEVHSLREQNESLKLEKAELIMEINKHKKHARDAESSLRQKMACLEHTLSGSKMRRHFKSSDGRWISTAHPLENNFESVRDDGLHHCRFVLQNELELDGARVMGIDGSSQIIMVSGKAPGIEREHVLSKISLLSQNEVETIQLPPNTKAIRDLTILPDGLALLASLGKKLLLFSMRSNNLVLKYDLPAPAWSCSGDNSNTHYVYTGLQNGMLLVFDIRQTAVPMQVMEGLTGHPVHTVHSVVLSDGGSRVLTASSSGPCIWEVGSSCGRPFLIPEMENRGVCISLACCGSLDSMVASFRQKVELFNDSMTSQIPMSPSPSPSPILSTTGKIGSHVLITGVDGLSFQSQEVGKSIVSELRMPKSAILCTEGDKSLFAYGDESSHGVHIWGLPSFKTYAKLKPHQHPILDLRYDQRSTGPGFLGCISEDRLQVFSCF
ncbi:unnamed protein product [Musa acuminata subsp. burmannicoides]